MVWIKRDDENGLAIDSYVDCNSCYIYTIAEFKQFYESNKVDFKGEVSEAIIEQIIIGIRDSPLIEEAIKEIVVPPDLL
ncbi:MAG: hypothetical protein HC880_15775 [Bacteroidia bacterium]|nr:hypothetical protein [Bacteroidia bacterium]